jgi:hypothetical protein
VTVLGVYVDPEAAFCALLAAGTVVGFLMVISAELER